MVITVNIKTSKFDLYIGRANRFKKLPKSKWHNPFAIPADGTRSEVITKYKTYILQQDHLIEALPELHNMRLGCWCKPLACHGDVLEELENVSFLSCCAVGRSITADEFRVIYDSFQDKQRDLTISEILELIEAGHHIQREQARTN